VAGLVPIWSPSSEIVAIARPETTRAALGNEYSNFRRIGTQIPKIPKISSIG
jgi:hypothetical protein